jgi:hypothetical protein
MTGNVRITGTKVVALPKPSRRLSEDRVCAVPKCETKLSMYNSRDKCWKHADFTIPRLRGKPQGAT